MTDLGHNGIDKTVLARWTGEILKIHDKLDSQKMENLRACKEIREPLSDLYEAAKNSGLPDKAFKAHVKAELAKRAYEKRLRNIEPEDDDEAAAFEMMREIAQSGDLFDAAVKAHDDDKDLRPRHLREADDSLKADLAKQEDRVKDNVRKLRGGIKPTDGSAAPDDGLGG